MDDHSGGAVPDPGSRLVLSVLSAGAHMGFIHVVKVQCNPFIAALDFGGGSFVSVGPDCIVHAIHCICWSVGRVRTCLLINDVQGDKQTPSVAKSRASLSSRQVIGILSIPRTVSSVFCTSRQDRTGFLADPPEPYPDKLRSTSADPNKHIPPHVILRKVLEAEI